MNRQSELRTLVVVALLLAPVALKAQPVGPLDTTGEPPADTPPPASVDATAPGPTPTQGPLEIGTPNGSNIKFGLLLQPQFQALGSTTVDGTALNLFMRRTRFIVGGTLFGVVDYFFDTDFANLDLAINNPPAMMGGPNTTSKNTPGLNIQDAFLTYRPLGDILKVDAGYMLPPMSHNAVQGAATLYSLDYFNYTFRHSDQFTIPPTTPSPVGRDVGVELRGLLVGDTSNTARACSRVCATSARLSSSRATSSASPGACR
jgi:hypothetical protein